MESSAVRNRLARLASFELGGRTGDDLGPAMKVIVEGVLRERELSSRLGTESYQCYDDLDTWSDYND